MDPIEWDHYPIPFPNLYCHEEAIPPWMDNAAEREAELTAGDDLFDATQPSPQTRVMASDDEEEEPNPSNSSLTASSDTLVVPVEEVTPKPHRKRARKPAVKCFQPRKRRRTQPEPEVKRVSGGTTAVFASARPPPPSILRLPPIPTKRPGLCYTCPGPRPHPVVQDPERRQMQIPGHYHIGMTGRLFFDRRWRRGEYYPAWPIDDEKEGHVAW
jgi:hypothetical protein